MSTKPSRLRSISWILFSSCLIGVIGLIAKGEPWVANRFAQNCAGCHAPGRYNREPIGRRCTLSCQGCHVNPNGGGMRNQYGIWTQERWMRSFRSPVVDDDPIPAPTAYQPYMKKKRIRKRPPRMLAIRSLSVDEALYDKDHYKEWHENVNERKFRSTIPSGDPYWLERTRPLYVSGDFRYLVIRSEETKSGEDTTTKEYNWPMAFDFGVRARPFKTNKVSLVVESRFLNLPQNQDLDQAFLSSARIRSAYVLADDLPYNSYFMGGLYRPMFGNINPDHESLAQQVSGFTYNSVYKAYGLGVAPNVPFLVANYIQPIRASGYSQDEGYAVALGARFVSFGASAKLSYWDTTAESSTGASTKRKMISATAGGMLGPLIANLEFLRVEVDDSEGLNAGNVYTAELKTKLWRENYLVTNYASANVTKELGPGTSDEIMVGLKAFPISNTELELLYILRNEHDTEANTEVEDKGLRVQAHIFF